MTNENEEGEVDSDPGRIAEPFVDTAIKVKGYPLFRYAKYAAPGIAVIFLGTITGLFLGNLAIAAASVPISMAVAATGLTLTMTTDYETNHPYDRVRAGVVEWLANRKYPLNNEEAAAEAVHGVQRMMDSGKTQMVDGRMVAFVGVDGRNTDKQTDEEDESMVTQWTTGIRRELDSRFAVFMTTFGTDPEAFLKKYEEQVFSDRFAGNKWIWVRELLHAVLDHEREEDTDYDPREMRSWVEVEVRPYEVDRKRKGTTESLTEAAKTGGAGDLTEYQRKQMISLLNDRIKDARNAVISVTGCDSYVAGPGEAAMLVADRWSVKKSNYQEADVTSSVAASVFPSEDDYGKTEDEAKSFRPAAVEGSDSPEEAVASIDDVDTNRQAVADGGETIQQKAKSLSMADVPDELFDGDEAEDASFLTRVREGLFNPVDLDSEPDHKESHDPVKAALAPGHYDPAPDGDYIEVGDRFARTYWLMNLDSMPNRDFLSGLAELKGVDFDLRIIADPIGRHDAEYRLQEKVEGSNASMEELEEIRDISAEAMTEDVDYLMTMYMLVKQGYCRAWDFNGYLTVFADNDAALDKAREKLDNHLTDEDSDFRMAVEKRDALDDLKDEVLDKIENHPANLSPVWVKSRADELYRSGSPGQRDLYNENSMKEKSSVVLTPTVGSAFCFGRNVVQHTNGIEYGRLLQSYRKLVSDPYEHGPGHKLLIGDTGSGKSVKGGTDGLRYWAGHDNATVVYVDTQGDYRPHVEVTNGQHITVDGSSKINPFDIEQTPEAMRAGSEISPFDMAVEGAVTWLSRIIGAQGAKSDDYVQLVEDITRQIFKDAEIYPGRPETHTREPPTMIEFISEVSELADESDLELNLEYTVTGTEAEAKEVQQNATKLARKLNQFKSDGKYRHLVGQTEKKIETGSVNYLDLQQIEGQGDAEKSTMLFLMLRKVYEAVKRATGPVIVLIDEAHYLLNSEEMIEWLQRAARHWRHHGAALWLASQNPDDFAGFGDSDVISQHKETIRKQCSITEWFPVNELDWKTADVFGLNYDQYQWINETAKPGEAGLGYSSGMCKFKDMEGYRRYEVKRSDFELAISTYDREEDGALYDHLKRNQKFTDPAAADAWIEQRTAQGATA